MSASTGVAPGAKNATDRSKKAERGGHNAHSGADSGRRQRQPQGVSARRAAQRVPHAQLLLRAALEGRHMLAEDKLLRLQHISRAHPAIPRESHWYWRFRSSIGTGIGTGVGAVPAALPNHEVGRRCLAHLDAISQSGSGVPARAGPNPASKPVPDRSCGRPELKWIENPYKVVTLRGLPAPGVPEPSPRT